MDILELVFRWLHVLSAVVLAGGTIFVRLSVVPALNKIESASEIFDAMRPAWARMVMASVLFLMISGVMNIYFKAINYQLDVVYLTLLAIKFVLALTIFFLVSLLSGRSDRAAKFRTGTGWYDITCVGLVALICIASFMKVSSQHMPRKAPKGTIETEQVADAHDLAYSQVIASANADLTRIR